MIIFLIILCFIALGATAYVVALLAEAAQHIQQAQSKWQAEVTRQLVQLGSLARIEQAAATAYREMGAALQQAPGVSEASKVSR